MYGQQTTGHGGQSHDPVTGVTGSATNGSVTIDYQDVMVALTVANSVLVAVTLLIQISEVLNS